jgi:hypothetical protein
MTLSIIRITERGGKAAAGQKVYTSSGSRSNRSATVRALAPQAPGRCWGHGSRSTSAHGQPPHVLEHDLPPPDGYRQPPLAGIFSSIPSPEREVRRRLQALHPLPR